ncbi:aldehyde-activating protein [Bacterioplanes sanyensis]|uniref:Aldehyde-activating protein n=1 Tax=Bacterioplanes sanyensis TaxID=1249553 RepID=A0A222FGP8_9GAMM|nr:GFA family protein [Bacterioplanes sanyensis]ASP37611.1 aldehyde-activating protein [Bacterioplanes sanyensis]
MTTQAQCLCGKVQLTVADLNPNFTVCHCRSCLQWNGGPLMMSPCGQAVELSGSDAIREYDSSPWAVRAFCQHCGTHLYSRFKQDNSYSLPVGLFAGQQFTMVMQYFIDRKPDYYCFSNDTDTLNSAQIAELYGQ